MRIIVAGWRNYTDTPLHRKYIYDKIREQIGGRLSYPGLYGQITVVEGACHLGGVDKLAYLASLELGVESERHPARDHPTEDFGSWPGCGPRRNNYMASLGADIGLLFPHPKEHKGTLDMARALIEHGIPSKTYPLISA